ncbi:bifunctional aldolase/short-chain dehydrogenase [uncultured Tistrella sp.]|uniref:bifunctional aldolase/short-chain dehydrogenase n=1 Tax=Tistrella mobilis TaxID=171437 RepID=UPI000C0AE6C6|nr:bifunctional aldolase/short-chain dehydrogenase [uncultured Tistrella sp.]MAM73346.1 bifunctional aldolase/short-chain dehydrogenase [Tistrella sp.]
MQNRWSDADAAAMVARYVDQGVNEDLALRVYTTRLLGSDPRLVLHGGGNTSVKTRMTDILGDPLDVLCVKGSGWDMGVIEPAGLPAVRLAPLRRLERLEALTDEEMVNVQRLNLLDSTAPNPSVETLLHAFLPQKFIDHTHANAVLSLTDQPDGEAIVRELYGDRVAYIPYIMPGFLLAKTAARIVRETPGVKGMVLLKHGIFSFDDDGRTAYELMIDFVSMAEERLTRGRRTLVQAAVPAGLAPVAAVAPVLRGLTALADPAAEGGRRPFVLEHRAGLAVMDFVNAADLDRIANSGVATPDHVIRTKPAPLILPAPRADDLAGFRAAAEAALGRYVEAYHAYFARNNERLGGIKTELDPMPRIVAVKGLGIFALGKSSKEARIAADVYEAAIEVITGAEGIGRFESISEADLFDVEYWSLEQAKLGKGGEKPLQRRIVAVTGGAGGIGAATARAFAAAGAEVAVLDLNPEAAAGVARPLGGIGIACDVTDPASVTAAIEAVVARFGGLDILVSNAGAAWQGRIGEVDEAVLRQSFELNFYGHQRVAQAAVKVMKAQGFGGQLLFNASKQAVNPGPDFGPYGLPKAATLFLSRQYALDHGRDGIRANAVNADRVRSGLLTDEMVAARSKARGLSEADYMGGNLLGREVTAADVAQAFVDLALAQKTTGSVTTVDGGNIAAALR